MLAAQIQKVELEDAMGVTLINTMFSTKNLSNYLRHQPARVVGGTPKYTTRPLSKPGRSAWSLFLAPTITHLFIISEPAKAKDIILTTLLGYYEPISEEAALVVGTLTRTEQKWRDVVFRLAAYELWPGLKPSWLEPGAYPLDCKDGEPLPVRWLIYRDIRCSDKSVVTPQARGCNPRGHR